MNVSWNHYRWEHFVNFYFYLMAEHVEHSILDARNEWRRRQLLCWQCNKLCWLSKRTKNVGVKFVVTDVLWLLGIRKLIENWPQINDISAVVTTFFVFFICDVKVFSNRKYDPQVVRTLLICPFCINLFKLLDTISRKIVPTFRCSRPSNCFYCPRSLW